MNKAKEFLEKIEVDNEDVMVLLEEMLESAFEAGFKEGFSKGVVLDLDDEIVTPDLFFNNWLNDLT